MSIIAQPAYLGFNTAPAGGSPPAWVPTDLAQISHWYRAKDISDGVDGNAYAVWEDQVGSNDTFSASPPTYRANAGNPYLEFDGVDDFLDTNILTAFGDFAWFAILRNRGGSGYERYIDKLFSEATLMRDGSGAGNTMVGGILQGGVAPFGDVVALVEDTLYAVVMQREGTAKKLVAAGNVVSSTVSATALTTLNSIIFGGAAGGNAPFSQLDLFEVGICGDSWANGDLANFSAYVLAEYGLTLASSF